MAARYWIGGGTNSNWNASPTTNWAATSGGTTRVAAPTTGDDVFFDGVGTNANTNSIISANTAVLNSLTITSGYTATLTFNANPTFTGAVVLGANMGIAGTGIIIFSGASGSITSNGKTFTGTISFVTGATLTLNDNLTINGQLGSSGLNYTLNGNNLYVKGSALCGSTSGTTNIYLIGTGAFQGTFSNNVTYNTTGTYTSTNLIVANGMTLTYVAGTVTGNLILNNNAILNTAGITWTSFTTTTTATSVTLNSLLSANSITISAYTFTFGGTAGFTTPSFSWTTTNATGAGTITLTAGNTYTVTGSLTANLFRYTIQSSSGTTRAILTLAGATTNTNQVFTRIDASGGNTIFTHYSTPVDCLNVVSFTDKRTVGISS